MKITKRQLRQIIKEERASLQALGEAANLSSGDYGMLVDAKRMLLTVIANLQDIGGSSVYGDGDDEIMEQLELLYDINNSMAAVLGMPGGTP
tara:strand:+ start:219 stop:494 length:276 start_codon:yes stop_codon:yes gene_type:complete